MPRKPTTLSRRALMVSSFAAGLAPALPALALPAAVPKLHTLPARTDNYIYVLDGPGYRIVVDPGEAAPLEALLAAAPPTHILITHHHPDHRGALPWLRATFPNAEAIGPAAEAAKIEGLTRHVAPGERIALGALTAAVLDVAGHTLGHVAFHLPDPGIAFVGDALFSLGCGRLFEGTATQFWNNLRALRDTLPEATALACGHEYTQTNLRFAQSVLPDDPALAAFAVRVAEARGAGRPTLPARLADERRLNPFLRADEPAIAAALALPVGTPPDEVFAELRRRRDVFR